MKKFRHTGFDFRTLSIFAFLFLAACSTGMETDELGEVEDSDAPMETADTAPTDIVPEEVAEVEPPPEDALPPQEAAPAPAETQALAQVEPAPAPVVEEIPVPPAEAAVAEAPVAEAPVAAVEPAPAPVAEPATGEGTAYTVRSGDTLMRISWEQYGTLFRWREIYQFNQGRISDPNHVPPGTQILLPSEGRNPAAAMEHNGDQYLIVRGDTLGRISDKVYGTIQKWKQLWENNRQLIRDPNKIYAGFYLYYVPEAKVGAAEEGVVPGEESTG